jgi:ABC-2 type transport system permease protein
MPVHDLGYRSWDGQRTHRLLRPLSVAASGISLVWQRKWLRLMLIIAWMPIVFPAMGIFAFEFSSTEPEMRDVTEGLLRGPLGRPDLAFMAGNDPDSVRHEVWSTFILTFFRYPQLTAMVMLVGMIAPMMVSYDLRSKAYLLYFSRPLSTWEYVLGKSAVIWVYLSLIVTVPALVLYVMGVLLSPDLSVIGQTWDIPLRILAASIVLVVPTTALATCFSACTSESRYAMFSWFATWTLGFVAYQILTYAPYRGDVPRKPGGRPDWNLLLEQIDYDRWRLLSPYHTLGKVQSWIFGLDTTDGSVVPAIVLLCVVTVFGLWMVDHRIKAKLTV